MQRIAQAATLENHRLRSLLNMHGVSQDEIHRYISSPPAPLPGSPTYSHESSALKCRACGSTSIVLENPPALSLGQQHQTYQNPSQSSVDCHLPSPSASSEAVEPSRVENNGQIRVDTAALTSPQGIPTVHGDPCTGNSDEREIVQLPQCQESGRRQCCASRSNEGNNQRGDKSLEVEPHLAAPHPLSNPIAPEAINPTDSMETSCDTAASILVDLHHHVDTEQARAALGCQGSKSCTVSNIKIFQLLEEEI
ncbi:hypothetical protein V8C42DRAFT_148560 [Trichoderma barbatum]